MKISVAAVFAFAAGAAEMEVVFFNGNLVAVSRSGDLIIALFDNDRARERCVHISQCSAEAAESLIASLRSAIDSMVTEK